MSIRIVSLASLLALAAGACNSEPSVSNEQRATTVVAGSAQVSVISQHFFGATGAAQVEASLRADLTDPTCLSVSADSDSMTADFDGCVWLDGSTIDGTVDATFHLDGTIDLTADGVLTGDLVIDGAWTLDASGLIDITAQWTGDLTIGAFGGTVDAHVTADLTFLGLCLGLSLDADAEVFASGSSAAGTASANASISVSALLLCDGVCPGGGSFSISIDGAASVDWQYDEASGQASGSVDASLDIDAMLDCPAE